MLDSRSLWCETCGVKVIGIETSCDETAAAVVEFAGQRRLRLLSNVVASSMDLHKKYGGVVPEIAARSHIEAINSAIEQALTEAKLDWSQVDAIAVTYGAGLGGSLLIGVLAARTAAIIHDKPLYACNHVEGHVYANFLTCTGSPLPASVQSPKLRKGSLRDATLQSPLLSRSSTSTPPSAARSRLASHQSPEQVQQWSLNGQTYTLPSSQPQFPLLALIVSGGHTQLVLFRDHFDYEILGRTQDDAIGEAFDKVAKIIGLPYPGGPSVAKEAAKGNPNKYKLPKAKLQGQFDFSFSGLKTAVLRLAQAECGVDYDFPSYKLPEKLSEAQKADIAASFQRVAVETVVDKTVATFESYRPKSVVIAGGVAANQELRHQLRQRLPIPVRYTDIKLCTDNAAMIAALGSFKMKLKQPTADPYSLDIAPNLSM